ncbi:hypothetical protein MUK42_17353 [Musa troglodytarum]|uniref:Uncharacterized protein n=1 Tax=Musa troglodytarum TaxID=320322 RepID=A0A9E7H5U6_9LILI|nr:hypothetical protein MUK42_17353 [Musa troglodytarum]
MKIPLCPLSKLSVAADRSLVNRSNERAAWRCSCALQHLRAPNSEEKSRGGMLFRMAAYSLSFFWKRIQRKSYFVVEGLEKYCCLKLLLHKADKRELRLQGPHVPPTVHLCWWSTRIASCDASWPVQAPVGRRRSVPLQVARSWQGMGEGVPTASPTDAMSSTLATSRRPTTDVGILPVMN